MALSGQEQHVCRLISQRREVLLDDLGLLVAIPTGGNHTAGLDETRDRLCERARAIGATVELVAGDPKPEWLYEVNSVRRVPPTAVCRNQQSSRAAKQQRGMRPGPVLIAGHLDTVHDPAGPFRELSVAPNGKTATGPGCVDMKGGLVIALAALEALRQAGVPAAWTLLLNSDEETGSFHSERTIRAEAALIAASGGVGLALEPAMPNGGLVIERAGSGQFLIEVRGKAAHVGRDFTSGISAVTGLARCLIEVAAISDPDRGLIANVGPIDGGAATNVVPDRARAWGNVRFPDAAAASELVNRLDALPHAAAAAGCTATVERAFNRPAKPLTPGTQRLADLARVVAADLGQRLPFGKTAGVCDGNLMQDASLACIDTVGVRGGGLHTPQEWIDLPSLVERCQMLAVLIARLSQTPQAHA